MREYENKLIEQKINIIAGTDEVGRGSLSGPLVAAAVILPNDFNHEMVRDSKTLSKKQLTKIDNLIRLNALDIAVEIIDVETIDKLNIKEASKQAMAKVIEKLRLRPDHVLVDYEKITSVIPQTSITKGDALSISIAAASIIAKVVRDNIMMELDKLYPIYDFKNNVGYGTKKHLEAIMQYGFTEHHRKTFNPVKALIKKRP